MPNHECAHYERCYTSLHSLKSDVQLQIFIAAYPVLCYGLVCEQGSVPSNGMLLWQAHLRLVVVQSIQSTMLTLAASKHKCVCGGHIINLALGSCQVSQLASS